MAATLRLPEAAGEKLPELTDKQDVQLPMAWVSRGLDGIAPLY